MLNHAYTRVEVAHNFPLHSGYRSQAGVTKILEGMALINSQEEGVGKVRP